MKEGILGNAMLLRGRIQSLRKKRCCSDFVSTASDRASMCATAVGTGLAGLGGIAAGLGAMAMDTTEEADLLEFELDGKPVKARVWVQVFKEGDEVEVVAEPDGDGWLGYGIRRMSDRIIALHPHCSRGRYAHYKASFSWFVKIVGGLVLAAFAIEMLGLLQACASGGAILALILAFIALQVSKSFSGFVRLAEGTFQAFGWPNVKNIDLPALTKKTKQPDDPGALGVLYFRY